MLTSSQIDEFHRNGFLNGGRILTDDELNELRSDLDSMLEKGPDGFTGEEPQPVSFRNMSQRGDESGALAVWQIVNYLGSLLSF